MLTCLAHASRFVHSHDGTPVGAIIVALVVGFSILRLARGGSR